MQGWRFLKRRLIAGNRHSNVHVLPTETSIYFWLDPVLNPGLARARTGVFFYVGGTQIFFAKGVFGLLNVSSLPASRAASAIAASALS